MTLMHPICVSFWPNETSESGQKHYHEWKHNHRSIRYDYKAQTVVVENDTHLNQS